jgi:hypothetical protein
MPINPTVTLINRNELLALLRDKAGAEMNSMVWATEPDLYAKTQDEAATPNPYRIGKGKSAVCTITKVNKVNGIVGGDYDRMVERRNEKAIQQERADMGLAPLEGDALNKEIAERFRKGESWHRPVFNEEGKATCIRVNKNDPNGDNGEPYVQFVYKAMGTPEYLVNATGATEPTENVSPFVVKKTNKYANQGLADGDEVAVVCPALESIIELAIDGERYRIADNFQMYPPETRRRLWDIAEEYASGERTMSAV